MRASFTGQTLDRICFVKCRFAHGEIPEPEVNLYGCGS